MTAVGVRIRLIRTRDEYTLLHPGEEGTVTLIDSRGTVHVKWDSGSCLGLIPNIDEWEEIDSA